MRFRVAQQHGLSNAHSPFRVVEQSGQEVEWTIDIWTSSESVAWPPPAAASINRYGRNRLARHAGLIQLTPQDVWEQYARAVAQRIRPVPPLQP